MNHAEQVFDDYLDNVEVKNWLELAKRVMFPKLKASALSIIIINSDPDPKLCLELGASILFGKPLILLSTKKLPIPAKLRALAHTVIEVDDFRSSKAEEKIKAAVEQALKETLNALTCLEEQP